MKIAKKILCAVTSAAILLTLTACNNGTTPSKIPSGSTSTSSSSSSSTESTSSENTVSVDEKYADAPTPVIAANKKPEDYSTEPVPFKTEIDEFYRQVKELPIPDEHKAAYNEHTSNGYIYTTAYSFTR